MGAFGRFLIFNAIVIQGGNIPARLLDLEYKTCSGVHYIVPSAVAESKCAIGRCGNSQARSEGEQHPSVYRFSYISEHNPHADHEIESRTNPRRF